MKPVKLINVELDTDFADLEPDDSLITKSEQGLLWIGQSNIKTDRLRVYEEITADLEADLLPYDVIIMSEDYDVLLLDGGMALNSKLTIVNGSGASIDVKMKTGETETIYQGTITLADGEFCTVLYAALESANRYYRIG